MCLGKNKPCVGSFDILTRIIKILKPVNAGGYWGSTMVSWNLVSTKMSTWAYLPKVELKGEKQHITLQGFVITRC